MRILAVDPGLRHCGVAAFEDGHLAFASSVRGATTGRGPEAWGIMARAVRNRFGRDFALLVVEQQQVYGPAQRKGDSDDLFQICGVAGAIIGMIDAPLNHGFYPREWKGQVNADIFTERIRDRLDEVEVRHIQPCPKSLEHNVLDAVGLGLHYLGRMAKKRVVPR